MKKITPAVFSLVLIAVLVIGMLAGILKPHTVAAFHADDDQVESQAGAWQTWVLETGSQLRPPAPPDKKQTKAEVQVLKELAGQRDQAALDRISYWNTGAPVYRWNEIAVSEAVENGQNSLIAARTLALFHAAVYDATIAAWDAKYTYNRLRPHRLDPSLKTVIDTPSSPAYPSEHAVAAGAASEILAYLFPERADFFREKAQEAGQAFLIAGVQYPSDVQTGLELGRQVAALVIERAKTDGSDAQWDGTMPSGPGYWTGTNPVLPIAGTWKTWVLASGSEFRPGPPFAYDSAELAAEMDEVKNYQRTPKSNSQAFFWEYGAGGTRNYWFWNEQLSKKHLEYSQLRNNPPRAARAYALMHIAYYDSFVACWDAKYTYWAIRPFQLDPTFQTLFPSPNHPSYPSAHSCLSGAAGEMLAYLFPRDAEMFRATVERVGESRIWAGIHFRSEIVSGQELGTAVAQKVIEHAKNDGSN
jgi:membrane-associated phospholipid phosphatase